MDPQLRMMLEVVHEAIVDAGTAHFRFCPCIMLNVRLGLGGAWTLS